MELKKHSHEDRVRIAKEVSGRIIQSYGENVVAVYIIGSTSKNLDRPYSDLEMIAALRDDAANEPSMKYYIYNGLIVQVEYRTESYTLKDASRLTREWPLAADESHNRIILFERQGFFSRLDRAGREAETADTKEVVGYGIVGMFEGLAVMMNGALGKDEIAVRTAGFWFAWDTAKLVLLLNRKYVPTSSWFWKEVNACKLKPEDFWKRIEKLAGFKHASTEEMIVIAKTLISDMLGIVEPLGVLVKSSEVIV